MNSSELNRLLSELQRQATYLTEQTIAYETQPPRKLLEQLEACQQAIDLTQLAIDGKLSPSAFEAAITPLKAILGGQPADAEKPAIAVRDVSGDVVAGDKISGDKVAGDKVEIHRNFVRVVFQGLPIWALLTIPIIVILIGWGAWLQFVPKKMPLNTFNVAVASFGNIDAAGNVSPSPDGEKLSEWVFRQLRTEYKTWPSGQPTVWHDSQNILTKRTKIGVVSGNSVSERRAAAQAIAERVGANMVVYGNLAVDETPVRFVPEFYVTAIRDEADEIVGEHQLGSPISVRLPIDLYDDRTGTFFEGNLGVRVDALVWFTRGLALDLSGRHADALDTFRQAEMALENWNDTQGKDVLYYFLGRELLFLSNPDFYPENADVAGEFLNQAEAAFNRAIAINPIYARGHIGLGGVYFQRAQYLLSPETRLVTSDLDDAILHYSQAITESLAVSDRQTELKGRLGRGLSYSLQGDALLRAGQFEAAADIYDRAVSEIEHSLALLTETQHRLSAQAYLGLGGAQEGRAYIARHIDHNDANARRFYENARVAYQHCVEQTEAEFYDTFLQDLRLTYCQPYRDDVLQILDSF